MATNRKKGSAALFELIDKSGAKSGRHSGSGMKMPAWLDKYNHPQGGVADDAAAQPGNSTVAPPGSGTSPRSASSMPPTGTDKPSLGQVYHAPIPPSDPTPAPATVVRPLGRAGTDNPVLLDVLVAKFRPWLLFALFFFIFLLIAGLIILATRRSAAPDNRTTANSFNDSDTNMPTAMQPGGNGGANNSAMPQLPMNPVPSPNIQILPANPVAKPQRRPTSRVGKVVPAADVPRLADHWYLVILTTQPQYARTAARFIALHGVSVSIETGTNNLAQVVSVRGFIHRGGRRALAFRRRVIAIGRLVPGIKRKHDSVWGDAYYVQIVRTH